jgi:hypothetical protein
MHQAMDCSSGQGRSIAGADLLRGDHYRLEGIAVIEDIIRNRYQGGGQDYTCQCSAPYEQSDLRKIRNIPRKHSIAPP